MSESKLEELLYATRKGGRSTGVLHSDRDCPYIRDIPDEDIIDRPTWAFEPEQDRCRVCSETDPKELVKRDNDQRTSQ